MRIKSFFWTSILIFFSVNAISQEAPHKDWFHLDFKTDNLRGVSTTQAYNFLKSKRKKSSTIIVAVIDSGIDIEHEDLKDNIWINKKEKAGNGKDDDKNGYVDDVYGWNFIGGMKDGKPVHVNQDTYEVTREYLRLKKKYEGKDKEDAENKKEFEYYEEVKKEFEIQKGQISGAYFQLSAIMQNYEALKKALGDKKFTKENISKVESDDKKVQTGKQMILGILSFNPDIPNAEALEEGLLEEKKYYQEALEYSYNLDFDPRRIVGDDYADKSEKIYGNYVVEGPDALHGTHVAGIIGANRKNSLGIQGIADNVQIMVLRTVPNGDERDKDVANSIRYAVDNGAKIINMSFGKSYSPDKSLVDEAVKYAEKKGVLLIHAAGNESLNIDKGNNFPNDEYEQDVLAKNWIEVGASSWGDEDNFVGNFSNYGKQNVDIFAPGVAIYSTIPDNEYTREDGTSMAAPVVAGVAALVWSYFPHLKATEVKEILMKSAVKYAGTKVTKPGSKKTVDFSELSVSGGIINAYEAVKLAYDKHNK